MIFYKLNYRKLKMTTTNQFNIVSFIETNPNTKLSGIYENKMLQKIQTCFNTNEQQLFATSFYCYTRYNKKDFVINFDEVWKWCGFTTKGNARRLLEKKFQKDIHYKVENSGKNSSDDKIVKTAYPIGEAVLTDKVSGKNGSEKIHGGKLCLSDGISKNK